MQTQSVQKCRQALHHNENTQCHCGEDEEDNVGDDRIEHSISLEQMQARHQAHMPQYFR